MIRMSYDVPYFERWCQGWCITYELIRVQFCFDCLLRYFRFSTKKKIGCSLLVTMLRPASQCTSHRLVRCPSLGRYASATSPMRSEVCLSPIECLSSCMLTCQVINKPSIRITQHPQCCIHCCYPSYTRSKLGRPHAPNACARQRVSPPGLRPPVFCIRSWERKLGMGL
jgi:hypothetical protein